MKKYSITRGSKTYNRVSKAAARKLYISGAPVYICPCKASPASPWSVGAEISRKYNSWSDEAGTPEYFNKLCDEATYYNCNYNELGRYLAYYSITE